MSEHRHPWTAARRRHALLLCAVWAILTLGCVTATHTLEVIQRDDGSTGGKILVEYEIHEPMHEYLLAQEGASPNPDGTEIVEGWTVELAEQGRIIRMGREFTAVQEFVATVPEMEYLLGGDEESEDLITQLEVVSSTLNSGDIQYEMALTVFIPPEEESEAARDSLFEEDPELIVALEASGDPRFLVSMTMPGAIIETTDNDAASGEAVSDSVVSWEFGPDDVGEHVLRAVSVVGPGALEEEAEEEEEQEEEEGETGEQTDQQKDEAENALLELLGTPTGKLIELTTVIETIMPYATAQSLAKGDASSASMAKAVVESDIKGVPPELLGSILGAMYLRKVTDAQGKPLFPALIAMDKVMHMMWIAALTDEDALTAVLRLQNILIRRDLGKLAAKQQAAPGAAP